MEILVWRETQLDLNFRFLFFDSTLKKDLFQYCELSVCIEAIYHVLNPFWIFAMSLKFSWINLKYLLQTERLHIYPLGDCQKDIFKSLNPSWTSPHVPSLVLQSHRTENNNKKQSNRIPPPPPHTATTTTTLKSYRGFLLTFVSLAFQVNLHIHHILNYVCHEFCLFAQYLISNLRCLTTFLTCVQKLTIWEKFIFLETWESYFFAKTKLKPKIKSEILEFL